MKALVMKDAYVLWKQLRIYVLVLAVMSLVGGAFNNIFVVVWCSMLPYTAIAYDERSRWGRMAAMMPYTRRDIVLSKYVLGWICMAGAAALGIAVQTAAALVGREGPDLVLLLTSLLGGVAALDITLPMIFRFGVEKGRLVFMIVIFGVAILGGASASVVEEMGRIPLPAMVIMTLLAAAATAVSIPLSMKLYRAE